MARKIIIDCDPGIEDAVALCLALFDPDLEVLAVTATAGNVPADKASRNVQTVIERLDPPRFPRIGAAVEPEYAPSVDTRRLNGDDGLGNLSLPVSELHHQHPSEKIITDIVQAGPEEVTILCLGPLTNIARLFRRDPELCSSVGQIVMTGGSVNALGNVTAAAEFNIFYDPTSAREVFRSHCTKTLVPLDVTSHVVFDLSLLEDLPAETTRAGALLRPMLTHAFRSHRQELGMEGIILSDVIGLLAAVHPSLFTTEEMVGDVETLGDLTTGMTVFDRRRHHRELPNMEVARKVDTAAAKDWVIRGLKRAGECS